MFTHWTELVKLCNDRSFCHGAFWRKGWEGGLLCQGTVDGVGENAKSEIRVSVLTDHACDLVFRDQCCQRMHVVSTRALSHNEG